MSPAANDPQAAQAAFVVVANRLPVDRVEQPDGSSEWRPSPGRPGHRVRAGHAPPRRGLGRLAGSPGRAARTVRPRRAAAGARAAVREEVADYYEGFSNATLWPLYHDVIAPPEFHREWWDAYVRVNQRFADRTAEVASKGATVWVQDYQLQLVPQMLRQQRPGPSGSASSCTSPSRPPSSTLSCHGGTRSCTACSGADLVGFQLPGGARNFVRLVRQRLQLETKTRPDHLRRRPQGAGAALPIAIDAKGLNELAGTQEAAERAAEIRRDLGDPRLLLLGVDRLDYTKGLLERIQAFGELLAEGRIDADETVLVQLAIPSRERVDQYRQLRDDIDRLVGRINGNAGRIGTAADRLPAHLLQPGGDGRPLPRGRRHGGDAASGRDEPGGQGVRRVPAGRRRRAGAERVHRGGARAAPGVPGQPARHQRAEGPAGRGHGGLAAGQGATDAGDAAAGVRERHRPLGDHLPRTTWRRSETS